ncbi:aminotransferase class V-fold PLP-dependent enzyme [Labedella endophytica]|uniref:Aminotransferase class V-fold PLP-dependent enzyme n=1 Tax=Labedella endophytica TaxID=1523160 RepID=A0A433JWE1_9MICO|nr:aminotransferase class V-fold PLP-dependent enzyme [Labedella endophytica]RUR03274.1 aminotransferase class V-fold PLP-dependent enzyme [Labedella endophytica]
MSLALDHPPAPAPVLDHDGRPARDSWSLSREAIHLNHGSYGAVPTATIEHHLSLIALQNDGPGAWFATAPLRVGEARESIAAFLRTSPELTAIVPNASAGVTVVLQSLDLAPGAEIVVTDHIYGAVKMAAERAVRRVDGTVRMVPIDLDATDDEVVEAIDAAVSDRTALVIVDQIASATARVFPVAALTRRLRAIGVPVLVDAAHAPGLYESPAADIDADYWIGNLHKWACAPSGTAALVVSPRVDADALNPLIDSWGAPDPFPRRFDTQGTVDLTAILAAPHALRTIEDEFGWDRMRTYVSALSAHAESLIATALEDATGVRARVDMPVHAPALRLVELPTGVVVTPEDAHVLHRVLRSLGFQTATTSWRGRGFLRLSAHLYNTADDYARFVETGVPALARLHADRIADEAAPLAALPTAAANLS